MRWPPWPSRRERRAAVTAAQLGAREARGRAQEAAVVARDLRQLVTEADNFAGIIEAAITGRTPRQEGER